MKRTFSGFIGLAAAIFGLSGCDDSETTQTVSCYLGADANPTTGEVTLDYDGFVGRAPSAGIPLAVVREEAERVFLRGCGYDGADVWGLELDVELAADVERPAPFEVLDLGAARLNALLSRCPDGSCTGGRRTWFGGGPSELVVEGVLREFDPVGGRLDLTATLIDVGAGTLETSPLQVSADLSWTPKYEPLISGSLDGQWVVEASGGSSETFYLELVQDGARLSGSLCDEEWNCTESDLTGVVADPAIRLRWTEDPEGDALVRQLRATVEQDGKSFEGTLSDDQSAPVPVSLERE